MARLALSLFLLAACAEAQTPRSSAPPGATPTAKDDDTEPVCHEEAITGSNMTRTVCRTKSQEERDREDAKAFSSKAARQRQTIH